MPQIDVFFEQIDLKLSLPFGVLNDNLVVRGLRFNFDHYSEYSKSSNIENPTKDEKSYRQHIKDEWKKRVDIQKDIRLKMIKEREDFEEYLK